jgi:polar amino acid transport system permease protein
LIFLATLQAFLPPLLAGAAVTLQVTLLAAVVALIAAFVAGLARLSKRRLVRLVAAVYVEVFRGTSAIVQLYYVFFVLPLVGIAVPPFTTAVFVLGLNTGAFGSEVVRAAVLNVPRAQVEATIALNMPVPLAMRKVILPQALQTMLPPFGNLLIELMKSTAIASLITIADLAFQGRELVRNTGQVTQAYVLVLLLYFVLAFPLTRIVKLLERRVGRNLRLGPLL